MRKERTKKNDDDDEREREREKKREHYLKALTNFVHVERRAAAAGHARETTGSAGHAAKSWREFSCASHYIFVCVDLSIR